MSKLTQVTGIPENEKTSFFTFDVDANKKINRLKLSSIPVYIFATTKKLYQRRCLRYSINLLFIIFLIGVLYYIYVFVIENIYFYANYTFFVQKYVKNNRSSGCVLPKLDPWDERAKSYYFKVPPIRCKEYQPYLTEVTINGILQWNLSDHSPADVKKLNCVYNEFKRTERNDTEISVSLAKKFVGSVQLKEAFVFVLCKRSNAVYYHNMHWWIPPETFQHLSKSDGQRPNVQIFILDALSQPNFMRQLPKTVKVLTEEMSSIVIKGLIKVGFNTFPNLGAMLTGKNVFGNDLPPRNDGFDDWPIIWKNFTQVGYVTSLVEDMPLFTAFNYMAKGFKNQPTDYYMRPFWLAISKNYENILGRSSKHCLGNTGEHRVILDFVKNNLKVYKDYSFFTIAVIGALSHDELNLVQVLDDELTQLFRWFHEKHSNNTILIVMGDHGINFGTFRWRTQLGRVESTMPFFSIFLPQNLRKVHPNLEENLRLNQYRMSSWYDIYDLLMDIVNLRFDKPRKQWSQHGNSLFYPLPEIRTCDEAGIPPEFCPCEEEVQLPSNSSTFDLSNIARGIVEYVNGLLKGSPQCTPLSLSHIYNAVKIIPNPSTAKAKGFQNVFRLSIFVEPGHALFEARMTSDAWSNGYKPIGMIVRLNKFGSTSNCVQDSVLRHYCCCNCSFN